MSQEKDPLSQYHRFLDETGDTTFYGRGDKLLVGTKGVSNTFGIALVKIRAPLDDVRTEILELQKQVESDELLNTIPSVRKRIEKGGFFFHACKDTPDVRAVFLRYLKTLSCEAEVVMARKLPEVFKAKHDRQEDSFYGDLLSHLIKRRLKRSGSLVLNVAERGSSTRDRVLFRALEIAKARASKRWETEELRSKVVYNVQNPQREPLLSISDYLAWAVQRVFEKGETRFYDYLFSKIRLVVDLYDFEKYGGSRNYYDKRNPLTSKNKISPPIT